MMKRHELCRVLAAIGLASTLGVSGVGRSAIDPAVFAQSRMAVTPGGAVAPTQAPLLTTTRGYRPPTQAEWRLLEGPRAGLFAYECAVDFNDPEALAALPNAAADTFALAPWWFQKCGGTLANHAVVRPLEYGHYHLIFEDDTLSCFDPGTGGFGRLQPDMSCSAAGVDYTHEPRYLVPHVGDERVHLYVVNQFVSPDDPYNDSTYDKKPFDLKRLRVRAGSTPVRVCYKKVQEVDGPWLTAPDVPQNGATPGAWLCWGQLGPALWDLSAWATNVREVKITATDGVTPFSVDDILIGVK